MRWANEPGMAPLSNLRKNLGLHAQESHHLVKLQGSSDKMQYCLFLDIIMENNSKFITHDYPPAGPVPRRGSLHVLQHYSNVCQNLLSALEQKGSALLQNLAAQCNSLVFTW